MQVLKRFDWTDTLLTKTEKQAVEDILVEYHDIFARHRMDIGMNTDIKVRLTPKDDKAIYSRTLPMPIHLKEDLFVELALMQKCGMLAFSFASRTFAYKRLAQGLSRSVSAFLSFMREYLDPVVKAHECAQCVDDIGFAANNSTDLTQNIRAVF